MAAVRLRLPRMTAKLARHRSAAAAGGPTLRPATRTTSREATHRGGLPPAVGTTVLAVVVLAALGIVVLGVLR